jgi:glycosyltransferase involved in cell wall biosynthesis
MSLSITAVGDSTDPRCWSGIPYHFSSAARRAGFAEEAWRLDLEKVRRARRIWNARQFLFGRGLGGFQYSAPFLDRLEAEVPTPLWSGEILSFNSHFPRSTTVRKNGGTLHHYLDAPFAALASGRGLDLRLPRGVVADALALEQDNFAASEHVVLMARWAAEVAVSECGVPAEKCHVILPGANLELPADWSFPYREGRSGKERPFTLGFVGMDWRRKGLPLLIEVHQALQRRGWKTRVLAAGEAPAELRSIPGVEFVGFLDKHRNPGSFLDFLANCDVGCLFSEREALGISTLEFLRAGVPVAGFAHEGMADTLPPDAGFRFPLGASAESLADELEHYLRDEALQDQLRRAARAWSKLVTWDRCVGEFQELWSTGTVANPLRLWKGITRRTE